MHTSERSEKIRLEGVSKTFEVRGSTVQALLPTDLKIYEGEFVALIGPSGCGKSTILNMISGMAPPTTGSVTYDGKLVSGVNRRVGYMTQKDTLLPWRTTADNIGISLELACSAVSARERHERVTEMIELVGLKGFESHYPGELSGGMRKRAALARSLIYKPETLLMDEPFGALDAQLKLVMQEELLKLVALRSMTTVFVTHDLGEAIALADRVLVFSGRPGHVKALRNVSIPKPRDMIRVRFEPEFAKLHEDLWEQLKADLLEEAFA